MKNYLLLCLAIMSVNFFEGISQTWTDISTPWITAVNLPQSGGANDGNWYCSGLTVNRLTGDVVVNFSTYGLWKSSDQGKTFVRIDQSTVGGICHGPWAIQCDQNDPKRIANFSLDGTAAYTADGVNWKKMTAVGRNWDFGAVDWSSPNPKVFVAARHEADWKFYLSVDGCVTWKPLDNTFNWSDPGTMIGVIDSNTIVYGHNNIIYRSTDYGLTWTQVSSAVIKSKVAVMFKGVCYVGTTTGLLVSKDKGVTWNNQGSPIDIVQGPLFGADEKTMVIVNANGVYKSTDAGTNWNLISTLTYGLGSGISSGPGRFPIHNVTWGVYQWEPVNNTCYASVLNSPAYKRYLGTADSISPSAPTNVTATNITSTGCTVSWAASTDNLGVVLYEMFKSGASPFATTATTSFNVTGLSPSTTYTIQVKAVDRAGNLSLGGSVTFTTAKDTVPPSAPSNVTATNITSTGCTVSWTAATDNIGVVSYEIFKSGVSIGATATTSFIVTGLSPMISFPILIKAKDAAGNLSLGDSVIVTPIDNVPPTPPTKITASGITSTECTISWKASTDNIGVALYEIFISGDSIGITETNSFNVTGLNPSATYQILVRAKDAAGNFSTKSGVLVTTKAADLNSAEPFREITIYPNPASDYILIEIPGSISGSVFICNASGIIVGEKKIQTNNIKMEVSAFPKGFYLLKIVSDQNCMTKSFFIQ